MEKIRYDKLLRYDEPPDRTYVVTVQEAIEIQCKSAAKCNYVYKNTQDALDDFIAVHWAYWVDDDRSK